MADKFPNPQVGDPVAYYGRSARNGRPSSRRFIERVTATQIIVAGQKYKRATGCLITSDRWDSDTIAPWDDALDAHLAALDAADAVAAQASALLARIGAAEISLRNKRTRYGTELRKWSAAELERLHALVLTIEDGAAALKATLEPDYNPDA